MEATDTAAFPSASLTATGCSKRYGLTQAIDGLTLSIERGTIHAIAGVNGSGKSTALKILSGQLQPDEGSISIDGKELRFRSPADALAHGVAIVSQERSLVPNLSVAENMFLGGRMAGRAAAIDWGETSKQARAVLGHLGVAIDPKLPVRRLAPNQQQLVEIARVMATRASYVLLDEPTSSLSSDEVAGLLGVLRTLRGKGVGVAYVSHRLDEVLQISDLVTVLRDGRLVSSAPAGDFDEEGLVTEMLGRRPAPLTRDADRRSNAQVVLSVKGLGVTGRVTQASLELRENEIVGLAGLEGSGTSELLAGIYGAIDSRGEVNLHGRRLGQRSPATSMRFGLAYLPPDRKLQALALERTVAENLLLGYSTGRGKLRPTRRKRESKIVGQAIRSYLIKCPHPNTEARRLSGGNQQKVVLARCLLGQPKVLLLDEPSRGVDVGAKREIYGLLQKAREGGLAVLVASGDMEELLEVCDRILIMRKGQIVAEADAKSADSESLVAIAAGHDTNAPGEAAPATLSK